MRGELDRAAASIQKIARGRSSRKRTVERLESVMNDEPATLVVACSSSPETKKVVSEVADERDIPWIHVDFDDETLTFHFQFFARNVAVVHPHDMVALPIERHVSKIRRDVDATADAVGMSAHATFGAL